MAGRPRAPWHVRQLLNNPGKRRMSSTAPEPLPALDPLPVEAPAYLTGRARDLWAELRQRAPWLHRSDQFIAAMWCAAEASFEAGPAGTSARHLRRLRSLGAALGLTPASRERLAELQSRMAAR